MEQTEKKTPEREGRSKAEEERRGKTESGRKERANCKWRLIEWWGQREWTLWKMAKRVRGSSLGSCQAAPVLCGEVVMQKKTAGGWGRRLWGRRRSRCRRTLEEMDEMTEPAEVSWRKLVRESACWSLKYNRSCILIETGSIGRTLNKYINTYGKRGFEEPGATLIWKMKGPSESREEDPWK